jgi:hypothetical protein
MVTLLPIEPLDDKHGALIVEAFSRLFINGGGQPDGSGSGSGSGYGNGYGHGDGYGYNGDGYGDGYGDKFPEEWSAPP